MEAPETRYVTVGDAQVAYQIVGSGPIDLVYHHGLCHLDLQWDVEPEAAFNRSLASFSRLILFDRRGCGASERMPHGRFPTWEEWNADLLAVLDAAESRSTAIFAEAEAGPMAMLFAAAHPDRVNALVLGNTAARFAKADDYPIGFEPADVERIADLLESVWGTEGLVVAFPSLAGDHAALGALARLSRAAATPRIAAAQYRYINGRLDARDALSHITTPTLVLHNRRPSGLDPTTGAPTGALYVAERIDGARFVEVPGEDSLFFAGDHAVVIDQVAEFLTGRRPPVASDRFLTTVLFTDIVSSTERAADLGDKRWRGLLDQHDLAVRNQLRRYHGLEIKNTGDGFVACFDGPARAIDCAVEIVHDVRALGLEARAGLHIGECERRGDDIAGLAVHISARIGALAEPGEVLVSRIVTDLTAGSGITFNDRGEHTLKGIPATWPLFAANPRQ